MSGGWSILLPIAGGIAFWLSFPDPGLHILAWVAFVPYLWFLMGRRSWGQVAVGHLLGIGAGFLGILFWVTEVITVQGGLPGWVAGIAWLLVALLLAVLTLPAALLTAWAARKGPVAAGLAFPGLWTASEILRNYLPFGGFPWAPLGASQLPFSAVVQIADLGSVHLVSFLVAAVNSSLALFFWSRKRTWLAGAVGLPLLACFYGAWRLLIWTPEPLPAIRVGLAQGAIGLREPAEHYAERYFKTLAGLYDEAVRKGAGWVVFPEAQNPFQIDRDFYFRQFWEDRVRLSGIPLLLNSTVADGPRYFNSAHLIDPAGGVSFRYDKVHLVPFGEYLPYSEWWNGAEALVAEVSAFSAGSEVRVGRVSGIPFSVLICYEAIFPELARQAVDGGAEILVNITNDGWFGRTSAPAQHLQLAAFRAIETRRTLLRAANTGYSAMITPEGRIIGRTGLFEEALVLEEAVPRRERTLYAAAGFVPCLALIMVSLLLAAAAGGSAKGNRS